MSFHFVGTTDVSSPQQRSKLFAFSLMNAFRMTILRSSLLIIWIYFIFDLMWHYFSHIKLVVVGFWPLP